MRLNVERAANIVMRTTPYLGHRALIFGIPMGGAVALVFALGLVGWFFGPGAYWTLAIGAALLIGWMMRAGGLFELGPAQKVDLGHVALMAEIVSQGDGPLGSEQTVWALEKVRARFPDTSDRAEAACRLYEAMSDINRCVFGARCFPSKPVICVMRSAVMARIFDSPEPNVWEAARRALALYAQTAKNLWVFVTAVEALKLGIVLLVLLGCMVIPFGPLARLLPADWALLRFSLFLLALIVTWGLKVVFLDPLAVAAVIQRFFVESDGLEPDAKLDAELEAEAPAYRAIAKLARQPRPTPTA